MEMFKSFLVTIITAMYSFVGYTPAPTPTPTPVPTVSSSPVATTTKAPAKVANNDPIVSCGPGQTSKQYVKDKASNCKNYVDCGLNNNTTFTLMLKSECDKKHSEANQNNTYTYPVTNTYQTTTYTAPTTYPPCTIYWSALNTSSTYTYMSPEECKKAQDSAKTTVSTTTVQTKSAEDIQKCKDAVSAETKSMINGCYIQYTDSSASDACARGIQQQQAPKNLACQY